MKKIKSKIIITVMLALLTGITMLTLTACGGTPALDRVLRGGFTVEIRYDANGGSFGAGTASDFAVFVRPDSRIPQPGNSRVAGATRHVYQPNPTWHLPLLDGYGEPLVCEDRGIVLVEEEPWNFDTRRVTDYDSGMTLFANWQRAFFFRFWFEEEGEDAEDGFVDLLVREEDGTISTDNANIRGPLGLRATLGAPRGLRREYSLRRVFNYLPVLDESGEPNADRERANNRELAGLTDVDIAALVHRAWVGVEPNEDGTITPNQAYEYSYHNLFTTWIRGDFTFVEQPSHLPVTGNVYLESDLNMAQWISFSRQPLDFDTAGLNNLDSTIFRGMESYNGTIIGNGYKIYNLNLSFVNDVSGRNDFGLFGLFTGTVRDVVFENMHIEVRHNIVPVLNVFPRNIGFFAGRIGAGAVVSNVTLEQGNQLTVYDPTPAQGGRPLVVNPSVPGFLFGQIPAGWTHGITGTIETDLTGYRVNAGLTA